MAPAKSPSVPAYNVAAGHSRWSLRVSDAGGSRRSYRNGRASAVAEGTSFPQGTPESSVGGTPGWNLSSSARRYGWPPPGLYLSVRRDFRPGLSSASRGSGVANLQWPQPSDGPRPTGVHRHPCVAYMGRFDLVLSNCSKGTRSQGGGAQVCRKVVRACSHPQGMFLQFETRRSGVGECARPGEVPPQPRGELRSQVPHLRLLFRAISLTVAWDDYSKQKQRMKWKLCAATRQVELKKQEKEEGCKRT